jgi:hypothetical protein
VIRIQNITNEPIQRHTIVFEESEITLTLRFLAGVQSWFFDVEFNGKSVYGVRLACGVLHIESSNFPFDFFIPPAQIDAFRATDFSDGRLNLIMLEADDMEAIRGAPVPI